MAQAGQPLRPHLTWRKPAASEPRRRDGRPMIPPGARSAVCRGCGRRGGRGNSCGNRPHRDLWRGTPALSTVLAVAKIVPAVTTGVDQRITLAESAAIVRFGYAGWRQHYAARFSDQTYYQFPRKPG
jgi:hypothetical protein